MPWAGVGGLADLAERAVRGAFGTGRVVRFRRGAGVYTTLVAPPPFDAAHEVWEAGSDGVPVSGTAPVVDALDADLGGRATLGDRFEIDGAAFQVVDVWPSGQGRSAKYRLARI